MLAKFKLHLNDDSNQFTNQTLTGICDFTREEGVLEVTLIWLLAIFSRHLRYDPLSGAL